MSYFTNDETVESLRKSHASLSRCCLDTKDDIDPVRVVASGNDGSDEASGWCLFENSDGRFGVLEDSEDNTGHG